MHEYTIQRSSSTVGTTLTAAFGAGCLAPLVAGGMSSVAEQPSVAGVWITREPTTASAPFGHFWSVSANRANAEHVRPLVPNQPTWTLDALRLKEAVATVFGNVNIQLTTHTDPDEGWSRTALEIHTGIEDTAASINAEDQFYAIVDADINLRHSLQNNIVAFF